MMFMWFVLLLAKACALSPYIPYQRRTSLHKYSEVNTVRLYTSSSESSLPPSDAESIPLRIIPGTIVAAEDEYKCWYVAEVLAVESDRVYVHYKDWEDDWDEWLPLDRIAPLPPPDRIPVAEEDLSPEALEKRRVSRLKGNDLWQFDKFNDAFCSKEWQCNVERFEKASEADDGLVSVARFESQLNARRLDTIGDARPESEAELNEYHTKRMAIVTNQRESSKITFELKPYHFRGDRTGLENDNKKNQVGGSAANAQAFTTARFDDTNNTNLLCDLWLRRDNALVMLCLSYCKLDETNTLHFEYAEFAKSFSDESTSLGLGLADPHPYLSASARDDNLFELRLPGRITCAFPRLLRPDTPGVLSLDWQFSTGRTQIDRVFERPDASLASFEVTDLLVREN